MAGQGWRLWHPGVGRCLYSESQRLLYGRGWTSIIRNPKSFDRFGIYILKIRAVIDRGVGETRCAVYEGKRLAEIYVRRWSDRNLPRYGDIFAGRITAIDPSLGGAFVDFGIGKPDTIQIAAYMEVSGIWKETPTNTLNVRVNKKIKQVNRKKDKLPSFVLVTEFGTPASKIVKDG